MRLTAEPCDADRDVGHCATGSSAEELARTDVAESRLRDEIHQRLADTEREAHRRPACDNAGVRDRAQNSEALNAMLTSPSGMVA